jgi:hypothetical protein
VRTTTTLEDRDVVEARVFAVEAGAVRRSSPPGP